MLVRTREINPQNTMSCQLMKFLSVQQSWTGFDTLFFKGEIVNILGLATHLYHNYSNLPLWHEIATGNMWRNEFGCFSSSFHYKIGSKLDLAHRLWFIDTQNRACCDIPSKEKKYVAKSSSSTTNNATWPLCIFQATYNLFRHTPIIHFWVTWEADGFEVSQNKQ